MSDHESNARIERLERLYRFWKRLALTALGLLVGGLFLGGGLIVRAYAIAAEERENAERALVSAQIIIGNERALMRAENKVKTHTLQEPEVQPPRRKPM